MIEYTKRESRREQGLARSLDELIAIAKRKGYRYPIAWANHIMEARKRKRF